MFSWWFTETQSSNQSTSDYPTTYSTASTETPFKYLSNGNEDYFTNDNIKFVENTAIHNDTIVILRNMVDSYSNFTKIFDSFRVDFKQHNQLDLVKFLVFLFAFLFTVTILIIILTQILKYFSLNVSFQGLFIYLSLIVE